MINQFSTAIQTIDSLHEEIIAILESAGPEGWNWKPDFPDNNSLYSIANHTILSQYWWIQENLNQVKIQRDRPAEFTARAETLDELKKLFYDVEALTKQVLEPIPESDLQEQRSVKGRSVTIEWIVMHVIEHTALHLGHMQITKQLLENQHKG